MLDLLFGHWNRNTRVDSDQSSVGWVGGLSRRTLAGPSITDEIALTYAAVWCATRIICETMSSLPASTYRRLSNGDRETAQDHYTWNLLRTSPNPKMAALPFIEGRTMHMVNRGNGFAEIDRNRDGEAANLWPIHAARVRPPGRNEDVGGASYLVRNNDGTETPLHDDDMLHIPGVFPEDGRWGKGVIQYARESLGFGLATERHGSAYFGSGAQPKGVLILPGLKDKEVRANFRKEWKEMHGSGSSEIAILPPEGKYQAISISNEDSQFIETRKFNINEWARWYRLPAHMLGDLERATHSNIEQQQIEFVIGFVTWVRRWEQECNRKLFLPEERGEYFIEFNLAGLLRGDMAARYTAYQIALQNGLMTINEVRRLENLPGIGPAGDVHYVQLNMSTAERMLLPPEPKEAAPRFEERNGQQQDQQASQFKDVARSVLRDALGRMFTQEAHAVRQASTRADFETWLSDFHAKHRGNCMAALSPASQALGAAGLRVSAVALADQSLADSRQQLLSAYNSQTPETFGAMLDGWTERRAAEQLGKITGDLDGIHIPPTHFAGGPGSGPQGGRHPKERTPRDRAKQAKESHNPSTKEKQDLSDKFEVKAAADLGLERSGDNRPMDNLSADSKIGVELKMIHDAKDNRVNMRKDSRERKEAWRDEKKGREAYIIAHDNRDTFQGGAHADKFSGHNLYVYRGLGAVSLSSMTKVNSMAEAKAFIHGKKK